MLSPRQKEIVLLKFQYMSNRQVAEKLGISTNTVRNTLTTVYEKAEVSCLLELYRKNERGKFVEVKTGCKMGPETHLP
jgi:DNA-binding NarL/FixJ family response regulator